jgi:hypothetical protein
VAGVTRTDRTVHGETDDGGEVVRYDRSGKWYVEYGKGIPRRAVSVREAAAMTTIPRLGLPGGSMFDRIVEGDA